jgi:PKD repeat protein
MKYFTLLLAVIFLTGLSSCKKTEEKKPPVAIFEVVPGTGPFTQTFTFNAHESQNPDAPDEDLYNRWDFDGDGIFDTEFSLNKGIEHVYTAADNYQVTLEVINSEGWTSQDLQTVVVYADSVPPVASFMAVPDSASVNTIFYFCAAASSDQYTPVEELQFRWDWQNDGSWDTPFMADTSIYHKYDLSGEYRVLLEVKNNFSITDTTSRRIIVYDL